MKIGIDASILARRKTTGINRFLRNVLRYIHEVDKKNEYFLCTPCQLPEYEIQGFNVITIGENKSIPQKYYYPFWLNFLLPLVLHKHRFDVFFQPNFVLPILSNSMTTKYVITIHDLIPQVTPQYREVIYRTYLNAVLPRSIERSHSIITVSESSKRDIIRLYNTPSDKISVIYEASDDKFRCRKIPPDKKIELTSRYELPDQFILHVGAIENRKNITGIIKIGDILQKSGRDIRMVLIGKAGHGSRSILREIRKRSNILYLGHVREHDLPYIYNLAKIFLFPSFYEGFGLPPLEAMQSGIPVLASNTSSLPEIIGDGGIMHHPQDYNGFAKNIIDLLDNEALYLRSRKKALAQVKKFSWKKSTKRIVRLFEK